MFRYVARMSGAATRLNLLWLFTITVTPYLMRLLFSGRSGSTSNAAQVLYAADECVAFVTFYAMVRVIERGNMVTHDAPKDMSVVTIRRVGPTLLGFLVSIPVSLLWSADAAFGCWIIFPAALTPVMLALRSRDRRRDRKQRAARGG